MHKVGMTFPTSHLKLHASHGHQSTGSIMRGKLGRGMGGGRRVMLVGGKLIVLYR